MAINLCFTYRGSGCSRWVDFIQANVLVSFHSLKTMDLGPLRGLSPLFSRNGAILGHSPIHQYQHFYAPAIKWQGGIQCLLCPSFRHSVIPSHQSFPSQLLLHPCMDLNETWYRCCTTSLEVHVGR